MSDESEFLELCARVLRVPAEGLSLATAREGLREWDSIAHLRLVMETEAAFGGEIPLERIPEIQTLGELLQWCISAKCTHGSTAVHFGEMHPRKLQKENGT